MNLPDGFDDLFNYHAPPHSGVVQAHELVRDELRAAAATVLVHLPAGDEAAMFVCRMQEAMFWANASIARNHEVFPWPAEGDTLSPEPPVTSPEPPA